MKRTIFLSIVVLALIFPAMALAEHKIHVQETITARVDASGTYTGTTADGTYYDFTDYDGYVSVQVSIADSGTLSMTFLECNAAPTTSGSFVEPEGFSDIMTGKTSADGTIFDSFTPEMGRYGTFELKETGGANGITVTIYPAIK